MTSEKKVTQWKGKTLQTHERTKFSNVANCQFTVIRNEDVEKLQDFWTVNGTPYKMVKYLMQDLAVWLKSEEPTRLENIATNLSVQVTIVYQKD